MLNRRAAAGAAVLLLRGWLTTGLTVTPMMNV